MKKLIIALFLITCFVSNAFGRTVKLDGIRKLEKPTILKVAADRTVYLSGVVDMNSIVKFKKELMETYVKDRRAELFIIINSPGGYVSDGLSVMQMIDSFKKTTTVNCIVDNKAYSMAAIILTGCSRAYSVANSEILFHEAAIKFSGRGTPGNLYRAAIAVLNANIETAKIIAENIGISVQDYMELILDKEWSLDENEAYRVGLIDSIVELQYY